jgi:hypothetical protein
MVGSVYGERKKLEFSESAKISLYIFMTYNYLVKYFMMLMVGN